MSVPDLTRRIVIGGDYNPFMTGKKASQMDIMPIENKDTVIPLF